MLQISKPNSDYVSIINLLMKHGAGELAYCISLNDEVDGRHLPIEIALESIVGFGLVSLVSCIPDKLVYFEAEQSYGAPERFILKKD